MTQNSNPSRKRNTTGTKPTTDLRAKRLFSHKQVVARLMQACIPEYHDCSIEEIIQECLSPRSPSFGIGKEENVPWTENDEHVICLNTEKILPGGKHAVHLDILFEANLPKDEKNKDKMLIGIEIQNDFRSIDNILGRGIFYLSVMTASQYGESFRAPHYARLRPVSSIWICPMAPKELASTILTVRNTIQVIPEEKSKAILKRLGPIALQTIVIINLNGDIKPPDDIRGFLWTLANQEMEEGNKFQIMKEVYRMNSTDELSSSIKDFSHCFFDWYGRNNFKRHMKQQFQEGKAEGLAKGKAEGLAKGKAEGLAKGKAEGMAKGKAEGLAMGDYQRKVITAQKMIQMGFPDAQITALLELTQGTLSDIREKFSADENEQK